MSNVKKTSPKKKVVKKPAVKKKAVKKAPAKKNPPPKKAVKKEGMNKMKRISISKLTINIGVGEPGDKLEKAYSLLEKVTGRKPIKTSSKKRIPKFNVRPGIQLGVKVTLRKGFKELLKNLLLAKDYTLNKSCFDNNGNLSFGIDEYVHIPGLKYDPKIPLFGFNVSLTIERPGYRIKRRRLNKVRIPKKHGVSQEEAIKFMEKDYGVTVK